MLVEFSFCESDTTWYDLVTALVALLDDLVEKGVLGSSNVLHELSVGFNTFWISCMDYRYHTEVVLLSCGFIWSVLGWEWFSSMTCVKWRFFLVGFSVGNSELRVKSADAKMEPSEFAHVGKWLCVHTITNTPHTSIDLISTHTCMYPPKPASTLIC